MSTQCGIALLSFYKKMLLNFKSKLYPLEFLILGAYSYKIFIEDLLNMDKALVYY